MQPPAPKYRRYESERGRTKSSYLCWIVLIHSSSFDPDILVVSYSPFFDPISHANIILIKRQLGYLLELLDFFNEKM